ncbi:MAG: glycosyltransferase family 4 protein [Ruminococcus sp.]|nr:glycosyltransferase family 4 protein [Ruminococcus sp.]
MNISFDAIPIIADKITGIGWCEIGQTQAVAKLFPDNNYEYTFFTSGKKSRIEKARTFAGNNINLNYSVFSGYLYRGLSAFLPVPYSLFFGKKSDITHFFNYIVPPFVHGKKIVTVHDMVYKTFPDTVRGRTRFMLESGLKKSMKRADIIITDSEFSRTEIIKYFPEYSAKIRVVPCGVDCEKFRPCTDPDIIKNVKKNLGIDGDYFLYVGTIEPRKNLKRLVRAYKILTRHIQNPPKLVIAGGKGWLYGDFFRLVEKLSLEKLVIFTEYVPTESMPPLISGAMAFVFPSLYEGFGLPPLEAMACGVPVLTSAEASLPEVTGDCAVICDAYSVKSIAESMYRLYKNTELRKYLSIKGIERASNFTWEKSAEKLYAIYRELLHEK